MLVYSIVWFIILLFLIYIYTVNLWMYIMSFGTWGLLELYILDFILFFIMPFILTLFILKMPLLFVIYWFLILVPRLLWREHTYLKNKKRGGKSRIQVHRPPLGFYW